MPLVKIIIEYFQPLMVNDILIQLVHKHNKLPNSEPISVPINLTPTDTKNILDSVLDKSNDYLLFIQADKFINNIDFMVHKHGLSIEETLIIEYTIVEHDINPDSCINHGSEITSVVVYDNELYVADSNGNLFLYSEIEFLEKKDDEERRDRQNIYKPAEKKKDECMVVKNSGETTITFDEMKIDNKQQDINTFANKKLLYSNDVPIRLLAVNEFPTIIVNQNNHIINVKDLSIIYGSNEIINNVAIYKEDIFYTTLGGMICQINIKDVKNKLIIQHKKHLSSINLTDNFIYLTSLTDGLHIINKDDNKLKTINLNMPCTAIEIFENTKYVIGTKGKIIKLVNDDIKEEINTDYKYLTKTCYHFENRLAVCEHYKITVYNTLENLPTHFITKENIISGLLWHKKDWLIVTHKNFIDFYRIK